LKIQQNTNGLLNVHQLITKKEREFDGILIYPLEVACKMIYQSGYKGEVFLWSFSSFNNSCFLIFWLQNENIEKKNLGLAAPLVFLSKLGHTWAEIDFCLKHLNYMFRKKTHLNYIIFQHAQIFAYIDDECVERERERERELKGREREKDTVYNYIYSIKIMSYIVLYNYT
ncbi:hypothetical protein ACJX0J_023689, partial [Zea mays]